MGLRLKIMVGLTLFSLFANAQETGNENRSEVFYQPKMGQSAFVVKLVSEISGSTDLVVTSTNTSIGKYEIGPSLLSYFTYSYGLSENHALSLGTYYGSVAVSFNTEESGGSKTTYKSEGLGDILFGYAGKFNLGLPVYLGATLGWSPQSKEETTADQAGSINSGGLNLAPYLGTSFSTGAHNFGLKISQYQSLQSEENLLSGGKEKHKGGSTTTISPYWEMNYSEGIFGAKLDFVTVGSRTTEGPNYTSTSNSYSQSGVGVFATYDMSADLTASAGYRNLRTNNQLASATFNKVSFSLHEVSLGLRFSF